MTFHSTIEDRRYDLAIVGGGITGAAAARDAALRGLSVILFEKEDFASGASSKTSKLAHGGLRYLEHGELGLVRESLRERNLLMKLYPHWVRPMQFIFPVYADSRRPLWQISLGIRMYQWLAQERPSYPHRTLSATDIGKIVPPLQQQLLRGGAAYTDAQMHDSRLVIENILDAEHHGASVHNYAKVTKIDTGKRDCVHLQVEIDGSVLTLQSSALLNTTGAWANRTLQSCGIHKPIVAPTKGSHIVLPDIGLESALILESPNDKRIVFIVPWENRTMVGTTDTFEVGAPEAVVVSDEDISYLLNAYNAHFPDRRCTPDDVRARFAGLRPLIAAPAGRSASKVSRKHRVQVDQGRIISVVGGKFTTYRAMAEEAIDRAVELLGVTGRLGPCCTHHTPLWLPPELSPFRACDTLTARYGPRAAGIAKMIAEDPTLSDRIDADMEYLKAELAYVVVYEKVRHLEDWLERRTHISLSRRLPLGFREAAQALLDTFRRQYGKG